MTNMELFKKVISAFPDMALSVVNIAAVISIAIGILLLPVHISYRFIIMGIYMLFAWHSFSKT